MSHRTRITFFIIYLFIFGLFVHLRGCKHHFNIVLTL